MEKHISVEYHERQLLREQRILSLIGEILSTDAMDLIHDFNILASQGKESITLLISSEGGDVFEGLAIIRAIRGAQQKGIKIIGQVYGQAQSMAFLILQCCDERVMGKSCLLMCHGVTAGMMGDVKDFDAQTKLMAYLRDEFSTLLSERCVKESYKEKGFWHSMLEENTPNYFTSSESLEMGLIDKIE